MRCTGAVWRYSVGSAAIASRLYRRRPDSVSPHCPVNTGVIRGYAGRGIGSSNLDCVRFGDTIVAVLASCGG